MLNPTLMCDFYKLSHREQYPEGTEFVYSTLVPRSNKYYEHSDNIVVFGIQSLVKKYFIDMFNKEFFNRPKEEVINEYKRTVKFTLGHENPEAKHLEQLHDLGYLPIDVRALKEGTVVHPNTPIMTIENTHSDFFWLTNYLETIISTQTWQAMTSATLAYDIRKMLDKYALETVGNTEAVDFQGHDFSMRGMSSLETTQLSSAGHAISFKGSDTVPVVNFLESYYNADVEKEIVVASIPACYDKDTEILTETGWKLFKDLEEGEKVAQYHEDGSIDFVVPTEYYNMHYKGTMIHFTSKDKGNKGYIDFKVTPNHRMIKKLNKDNSIQVVEAQDKNVYSGRNKVVVSGKSSIKDSKLSAMDRLKIAFQADGSFMNRKDSYNGKHSNGEKPIRFSLKKDRKKERLVELLDELGLYYTLSKYENGYYSFYIKSNEEFRKDFDWINLSSVSYEWADEFIQELKFWDGKQSSKNTITYSTIVKRNIDKVQAIGHLAEYKGLITEYDDLRNDSNRQLLYSITFTKNKTSIGGSIVTKHEAEYDDTVHCVSVPTKMLVVRRNDVVGVSGNTEHSVMCANGDYETMDEYETYKRMLTEVYPTGVFSIVSDTWDFWGNMTKTLPRLKDIIMERDGKIVVRPDCYDEETEVYTSNGWKYFKDLSKDDLVAQVLDNGEYEFTKPLKYVNEYYKGNMHHFKDHYGKVDLLVTPNHRMILEQEGKERIIFAEDMKEKGNHKQKMIRSAKAKETGKILTPIERLKIAFQADGSFVTKQPNSIRFSFSKQRKMERLEDIISQCNLEVRAYNLSDDSVEYHIKVPNEEFKKDFSWVDTENLSYQWCIDFIEELSYWDSTRRSDNRFKFDTTVKEVADVVFDIGFSAGYGVYKVESADDRKEHFSDVHTLHIMKDNKVGGQSWTNTTEEYEGNIYCVQVPTGRLLVKRNKCTMVCGNSGDPVKIICGDPDADTEYERKGAVEVLWDTFGGTETEKGYKVLDEHVGLIYGDSINYERAHQICEGLKEKGFASINVVLGLGSFSYQFNTRDTHGFAIKATYAKIKNEEKLIYKNPKTDSGKRSHKGRVAVYEDGSWEDNLNLHQWLNKQNLNQLERVFEDGKLYRDQSLSEIREIIKNN